MKLFLMRAVLVATAISAVLIESERQSSPGIGFALAMVLLISAVLVGSKD